MNEHPSRDLRNAELAAMLADARDRFTDANPRSRARHKEAASFLPGGNTRAVLWYRPFPVTVTGGEGCHVEDLDGHRYIDFVSEYSAGLYGHSDPVIAEALVEAVRKGTALGAPNVIEAQYAAAIVARFPAVERVRFCNSGTEANIMALSTARAVTGRSKVVVFREGYHGGVLTFAHGGSPLNLPFDYLFADYNDAEGTAALISAHGPTVAAVIMEPMLGGGGCIPAELPFLQLLREITEQQGILLIFDEVMTSRLSYHALHGALGINPDLVTFGKYLGGGASFGAFGGRASIMDRFDPGTAGAFSHGGTFNNNVLSMSAGYAGFTRVLTPDAIRRVNDLGDRMRRAMNDALERYGVAGIVVGRGSLMNLHFGVTEMRSPNALDGVDGDPLALWQMEMLLRGHHVTPRGMLALSLPFTERDVDQFLADFDDFLSLHRHVLPGRASA